MSQVILSWFPSVAFANVFGIVVLGALLMDWFIPGLAGARGFSLGQRLDRGSSLAIQLAGLGGFAVAMYLRFRNIGIVSAGVQVLALMLLILGTLFREWAVLLLGRWFSRSVRIEQGQRLITAGPYRWIRHPAYTGMIVMDLAIVLGLGTWVGTLFMLVVILSASLYRIHVEERALMGAFGDEYSVYVSHTWRLFPGW